MVDPDEVNEWLKKAEEDRRVVEILLISGEELTLPSMFHLQQMLEKLLKAIILVRVGSLERTHDLTRLVHLADVHTIDGLLELCDTLNLFAVHGRYPGDLPEVSISAAKTYYNTASGIRQQLLELLSS